MTKLQSQKFTEKYENSICILFPHYINFNDYSLRSLWQDYKEISIK